MTWLADENADPVYFALTGASVRDTAKAELSLRLTLPHLSFCQSVSLHLFTAYYTIRRPSSLHDLHASCQTW